MNVLAGRGHGTRTVLARAALLQGGSGHLTLAADVVAEAARRARRRDALDVIVVARDAAEALYLRLPGLAVVGVVAEEDAPYPLPGGVSAVTGAHGALFAVPEGEWVIVDPLRGRALIAPDAAAIARTQAGSERPRVLLGAAHLPARTQKGVEVAVWAVARCDDDLERAMAQGADGVLVPSDFLGEPPDISETQERRLLRAADAVGGGPVGLYAPPGPLDPLAVVRLAACCQALWFLRPDALSLEIAALREELAALVAEEQDADRPARMPRLAAILPADPAGDHDLPAYDELLLVGADPENVLPAAARVAPRRPGNRHPARGRRGRGGRHRRAAPGRPVQRPHPFPGVTAPCPMPERPGPCTWSACPRTAPSAKGCRTPSPLSAARCGSR